MENQVSERVIIAGAGPVGLTMAWMLVNRDIPVTVLEVADEVQDIPRASTFHPPTLEMLEELGVVDELLEQGIRADRFQFRERRGGVVAEFDLSVLKDDTPYPFRLQCPQDRLAKSLVKRLEEHPLAELRFGTRVDGIVRNDDEAVVLRVEGPNGSEELRAPYVVGADGASSTIRKSLGVGFEGTTYPDRYLQVMSRLDLSDYIEDLAPVNYIFDPEEWVVIMQNPGYWRLLFPVTPEESEEDALDPEKIAERIRRVVPTEEDLDVFYYALYTIHQRVASTFRKGRVMLIGDAAHVNSPMGGMGMNSGIHDAYFLADPLEAVLKGKAPDSVLDEWADDRHRIAMEYVQIASIRNTKAIEAKDPEVRARRNEELRERASDPKLAREYLLGSSMIASLRKTS